jgi:hypothetical protein
MDTENWLHKRIGSVMNAVKYFPDRYRADLQFFAEGDIPHHGPFWMLCGMTLGRVFEPGNIDKYTDPACFLCVLYELNLLNQGIYTYFPEDHPLWIATCEPFPDIRGCSYGHGGFTHAPASILRFSDDPRYIPGARPIPISHQKLCEFTDFFVRNYLPVVCEQSPFRALTSLALVERLVSDGDCPEFSQYADPTNA